MVSLMVVFMCIMRKWCIQLSRRGSFFLSHPRISWALANSHENFWWTTSVKDDWMECSWVASHLIIKIITETVLRVTHIHGERVSSTFNWSWQHLYSSINRSWRPSNLTSYLFYFTVIVLGLLIVVVDDCPRAQFYYRKWSFRSKLL